MKEFEGKPVDIKFLNEITKESNNQQALASAYYGLYTLLRLALRMPEDKLKKQASPILSKDIVFVQKEGCTAALLLCARNRAFRTGFPVMYSKAFFLDVRR